MGATMPAGATVRRGHGLPDRYPLVRQIARGGMATVWCARDRMLDRKVAIKLMADGYLRDPDATPRFEREARAAARLSSHAHVVTIFDVGETSADADPAERARPYIVMEFLAGGTVGDALRVGELDIDKTLRWIAEAGSALDYAHRQGVIHRDIKPANLLLDCQARIHVGDFGIAHVVSEETITSGAQLFGTAAYLAPEQVRGQPASPASDRYALAVVAFELLVGERPFIGRNAVAQARQRLHQPPPRPAERNPDLPAAVDAVLTRGMARNPEERWSSCEEFAAALSEALGRKLQAPATAVARRRHLTARRRHPAPGAAPPSSREPRRPARARHRVGALLAVAVVAILASMAALGSLSPRRAAAPTAQARRAPSAGQPRHALRPRRHPQPPRVTSQTASSAPVVTHTSAPAPPAPPSPQPQDKGRRHQQPAGATVPSGGASPRPGNAPGDAGAPASGGAAPVPAGGPDGRTTADLRHKGRPPWAHGHGGD